MNLSRIVLGIGITVSVAFVLSLYITSVAAQNQSSSTSASTATTTDITIPQGASAQQVTQFYMPVNASIPKDATVTWTNKDIAPHTATADDGSFDAGTINPGSTASAMITGQGTVPYHCNIHPWMHGSLQVSS
jgi:plastocyanin